MQRLEVSGAVRPIYGSLGVKRLACVRDQNSVLYSGAHVFKSGPLQGFLSEVFVNSVNVWKMKPGYFLKYKTTIYSYHNHITA